VSVTAPRTSLSAHRQTDENALSQSSAPEVAWGLDLRLGLRHSHCLRSLRCLRNWKLCGAGGFLHAGRLKTLSLLELVYDGFLAPQESSK
jgi:hypothetical protein